MIDWSKGPDDDAGGPETPADPRSERFADGIELDTSGPDDPIKALWQALAEENADRAMGAFRRLEAQGKQPDLEPTLALELADLLEKNDMPLDAARACRLAAETDLDGPEAPLAILRGAKLLLGPANNTAAGRAMLAFMIERYPQHRHTPEARDLIERLDRGEPTGPEAPPRIGVVPHSTSEPPPAEPAGPATGNTFARAVQRVTGRVGSRRYRSLARVVKTAMVVCLLAYAVTWYYRDRFQTVDEIHPAVRKQPKQWETSLAPFEFTRDGYHYKITPRAEYDLAGLILSLRDYRFMSVRQSDQVFPMDLCVIWGGNTMGGGHNSPDISVSQHGRFCVIKTGCGVRFDGRQLSNNHLLLAEPELDDVLGTLAPGDQVRIRGQLVDVEAFLVGSGGTYDPKAFRLKTSTTRRDVQGGACEIIYARDIRVLARANLWARITNDLAFWLLVLLLGVSILRLLLLPVRIRDIA